MDKYRSQEMLDGKEIAIFQRAIAGWILGAGTQSRFDQLTDTLPISLTPPVDAVQRRSLRVLSMVAELHKAGYQRLRIAAGMSPSGCYWRCHITPTDNVRANGWEPIDWDTGIASYTSGDEDRYFGWKDAPGKSARQLAQLFVERFPELARRGAGRDRPYAGWFVGMLGAAENGRLPIFFADWDIEQFESEMPPPPGGIGVATGAKTAETILEVGAEGGSVRVVGICVDGEWRFSLETNERALVDEAVDGSSEGGVVWLNSWRSALNAVDKYPWPNLYPLSVHPDFRKRILSALKTRLSSQDKSAWHLWLDLLRPLAK